MVNAAENIASDDTPVALDQPTMWRIFVKAKMGPCQIVVVDILD